MAPDPDLESFLRLLNAIRPFLGEVVIVGGWAHRLYRYHSDAILPLHEPLFTTDTDIAIPSDLSLRQQELLERLRAHGFVEDFMGEDHPPVTHYRLGNEQSGFYAEFLTPLIGRGRPGKRQGHTAEIGGVVAQRLPHLDMLLIEPWSIRSVIRPPALPFESESRILSRTLHTNSSYSNTENLRTDRKISCTSMTRWSSSDQFWCSWRDCGERRCARASTESLRRSKN